MSIKLIRWDITPKVNDEHYLHLNQYAPTPIHLYNINGVNCNDIPLSVSSGFYAKFPGTVKKPAKTFFIPVGSGYNPNFIGGDPTTDWSTCKPVVWDNSFSVISFLDQDRKSPIILPSRDYDERIVFLSFLADVVKDEYFHFNVISKKNARYLRLEFGCNSRSFSTYMMIHFYGEKATQSNIVVSYRGHCKKISWEGISNPTSV